MGTRSEQLQCGQRQARRDATEISLNLKMRSTLMEPVLLLLCLPPQAVQNLPGRY